MEKTITETRHKHTGILKHLNYIEVLCSQCLQGKRIMKQEKTRYWDLLPYFYGALVLRGS